MPEYLETIIDKFTFRVAADRLYTRQGAWARLEENGRVRVGVSDFLQQSSGDVAFAEVRAEGTELDTGDEIASIETIKVNVSLGAPVPGTVVAANPALETGPEIINSDPYGEGWLAEIAPADWEAGRTELLDAQAYFDVMKAEAEARQG
jgi:glycine cleavage system H protein